MDDIEDIPDAYSQEEINSARDELKSMTPEDLLTLKGELDRAYANQAMPEAVSICFTEVYTSKGNKINITCRGMTGKQAIDELADTLRYARDRYNMHVGHTQPQSMSQTVEESEPHYVDIPVEVGLYTPSGAPSGTAIDDIAVTTITRERKKDGKGDFLRVRGGTYTKYGAPAYDNVMPKSFDITKLQYGIETLPPTGMTTAKVQAELDASGKKSKAKVIAFS